MVSPPTIATGHRTRENVLSFEALASKIQLTQLCEKAYFQYRVTAGKQYKIRQDGADGWETITPLCREYSISRSSPKSQVVAAIPEGTIIGPVWEVQIVKILDGYGIEVAIQSIADPVNTSHVVISSRAFFFVNEIHDHREELRSSNELLTDLQRSERSERHEEEEDPIASRKRVRALKCPSTQKRTIPTNERKWKVIQMEETWQMQSPKWLQKWCVVTTKMDDDLTVQCIGTQLGRYCCKRLQNREYKISQKKLVTPDS